MMGSVLISSYRHATANAVVGDPHSVVARPRDIPPPPFRLASLPYRKHHTLPKPTLPTEKRVLARPNGTCDPQGLEEMEHAQLRGCSWLHTCTPPFRLASLTYRKQHALPKPISPTEKRGLARPNGTSDPQGLEVTKHAVKALIPDPPRLPVNLSLYLALHIVGKQREKVDAREVFHVIDGATIMI